MESEYVPKSELVDNEEVELSSNSITNASSEMLKTSEEQEDSDQKQVDDNSVLTQSKSCEVAPSNDIVTNGESMTPSESVASPDNFVAATQGSATEMVPSESVGVEVENKDQAEVGVADDVNTKVEAPSNEESVLSPVELTTESNASATEMENPEGLEVQTETQDQEKVRLADDIDAEVEFPLSNDESGLTPEVFVVASTGSGTEVASPGVLGFKTETQDQAKVGCADDIDAEEQIPPKGDTAMSPEDFVPESNESNIEVAPSEVVEEVEAETQEQAEVDVADNINVKEDVPPKEETVESPEETNGSITEVVPSEAVGVETTETHDQVEVGVADDINAEELIPPKEVPVISPEEFVAESTGNGAEVAPSEEAEVETETQDQSEVRVADDIDIKEETPLKDVSVTSPEEFVAESNGSGIEEIPSEAVDVGAAHDIDSKEENIPSNEGQTEDIQVQTENSITPIAQEVSAPVTHTENHSTIAFDGTVDADDVFETSMQQPTDAASQDASKKDDDGSEMKAVEADQHQQSVSGDFFQYPELLTDADFRSLEFQKAEGTNRNDGTIESSASEVFHEEDEQREKKFDDNESPMATLGTDYASLARSQSSDSNASEGRLSQEPVNRTQVEKVAAPEIAKNVRMMFESGQIQDLHEIIKTVASLEEPTGSGVFENEPVQLEGVVRSGDYVNDVDDVQKGATKNLLSQWKDKGKEEFKADRRPVNLAEDEGKVLENEPVRRNDVVREEDTDETKELPTKGQTNTLTQQWISRKDDFEKEQKPIKLFEDETEPSVVENQPEVRTDVLREDDNLEEIWLRKGFTKDLAGYWAGPKEEVRAAREAVDLGRESDGVIAENNPTKLEGVVRGDDLTEEVLPIEKGRARSMVSKWSTLPEESAKTPFQLNINPDEAGVYENDPIQLEGVVRCSSQVDEVLGQQGMIKNIAGRFLQSEEVPRNRKEMIVIDKAEGPSVLENDPEPVRADVVRGEYTAADEVQVEKGTTKNLVHKWKTQDLDLSATRQLIVDRSNPSWIHQGAETATESGVFENQPQERADVFREAVYEPEMISVKETRTMREKWSKMGLDDGRKPERAPELVRFTPPREMTPPLASQEEYKSYQALTLSSDSTYTSCGPTPTINGSNNRLAAAQPRSPPVYSPGGSNYAAQSPSSDQTLKSSAMLVLKSS